MEVLLVIAIILLVFVLYWGPGQGSRQRALETSCRRNLERTFIALQIYAADHGGRFPVAAGARTSEEPLDKLVPRYTSDTAAFICPLSKDPAPPGGGSFLKGKISYAYYMGNTLSNTAAVLMSDAQADTLAKVRGQPVFSVTGEPPGNNHGKSGGNFLFGDGHVAATSARAEFPLPLEPGVVLLNPKSKP